ncbi:MAG: helix-hairpin-helix domain-containing protein [Dehalococcoidales bacterium]|nr:helix-hairpin-helix domain-containing protein [Dehalococcoidales bacterium]
MTTSKLWTPLTILLVVIIAIVGIIVWSRVSAGRPAEISITDSYPTLETTGEVYIGGAVASPGRYPLTAEDTIEALVQAAGGVVAGGDGEVIELYIDSEAGETAQKIDINRAEGWLLEALPGIGKERAQAIIDYRTEHGPFRTTSELTKVSGIGAKTLEQIEPLITVAGRS